MAVATQDFPVSKYALSGGAQINCADHVHLHEATFWTLPLAFSRENVREAIVLWDLRQSYTIDHGVDGCCVHMNRHTCRSMDYANRPIFCRGYDCRQVKRICLGR